MTGICVSPGGYNITTGKQYEITEEEFVGGDLFYTFIDDYGEEVEAYAWRFSVNPFEVEIL